MASTHTSRSRLVVATGNAHKVEELRAALSAGLDACGLELCSLADLRSEGFGTLVEPEERHDTDATFLGNATIKAKGYASQIGLPCLADDSGLEVDALQGAPGVISSHFAWDGETSGAAADLSRGERDGANNARLLREMSGIEDGGRSARFVCQLVLVSADDELLHCSRGTLEGRVGREPNVPRGGNGFGYDPLIEVAPAFDRTVAELSADQKNAMSHRGKAAMDMAAWLKAFGVTMTSQD